MAATLLALTIVWSLVYTELFIMALCLLFGPEGDRGDWVLWLQARVRNRKHAKTTQLSA